MDFETDTLIGSLVIGGIGTVSFLYGKKQGRVPHMVAGFLLFAYPYFISNIFVMVGIAIVLLAGLWASVKYLRL